MWKLLIFIFLKITYVRKKFTYYLSIGSINWLISELILVNELVTKCKWTWCECERTWSEYPSHHW
jgi:hypothetical protein